MTTERHIFNSIILSQQEVFDMEIIDVLAERYPWLDFLGVIRIREAQKSNDKQKFAILMNNYALSYLSNSYHNLMTSKTYMSYIKNNLQRAKKLQKTSTNFDSQKSSVIIDEFLKKECTKSRVELFDKQTSNVDLTASNEEGIISEDIANVYLKLGDKEEAIKIFSKLSLKFPEKNAYFAQIINRVKGAEGIN
ncbi:MAG: hypothetical protein IMY73_02345 [Bacteroidetes bacterium]|nr:hypothetical protein [Bacteroidota bacterium]